MRRCLRIDLGSPLFVSLLFISLLLSSSSTSAKEPIREIPQVSPETVGMSSEKLGEVDAVMKGFVSQSKLAGGIVMIARRDKIAYAKAFGSMDLKAKKTMQLDTIMRFYSMSKAITSAAAMILYDEGKLDLDAPVAKYLPEFKSLQVQHGESTKPAAKVMLVKDLLRHTSGLTYGFIGNGPVERAYHRVNLLDPESTLADFSGKLSKIPLRYEPGTDWTYSVSIDVLGRVIEVVSEQSLDDFFRERIFQPLNMRDTGFDVPANKLERFAANYNSDGKGTLSLHDSPQASRYARTAKFYSGGGGLVSTARDYMRFLMMISNNGQLYGQRILEPSTVKLMTTNQVPKQVGWIYFGEQVREGVGFGYGFSVRTKMSDWDPQGKLGEYGWGGAASTHYWVSPQHDLIVVTLEQTMPYSFATEFALKGLIYDAVVD